MHFRSRLQSAPRRAPRNGERRHRLPGGLFPRRHQALPTKPPSYGNCLSINRSAYRAGANEAVKNIIIRDGGSGLIVLLILCRARRAWMPIAYLKKIPDRGERVRCARHLLLGKREECGFVADQDVERALVFVRSLSL